MKDLELATKSEQEEFLNSFDEVLSDVDGVLCTFIHKIPGSNEAVAALRKLGKKVRFVSNNSLTRHDKFCKKLYKLEFISDKSELIIPSLAIIDYLKSINFTKKAYVISMSGMKEDLKEAGIKLAEDAPHRIEESLLVVLENLVDDEEVGAVIVDADINLNYIALLKCVTYLKRPEVLFITGATDARAPLGAGLLLIGPKYFLQPLEDFSEKKPYSLAKPSPNFNNYIVKKYNIKDPSRVLFIGDNVSEDMGFGTACGYKKLLVLSGLTRPEDIETWMWPDEYKPQYYVSSLKVIADIHLNLFVNKP